MKKAISLALALSLSSVLSTTAFAAAIEENGGKQDIGVKAKYIENIVTEKTIYADVVWGEMEFTYSVSGSKIWNVDEHDYDLESEGKWSASGNEISVTNHSNTPIAADVTYKPLAGYSEVTGKLTKESFELPSAEGKTYDDASLTETTELTLSGELSCDVTKMTKVGTATVTISESDGSSIVKEAATYAELKDAIAQGGSVKLTGDITLSSRINCKKDVVIDLDGHTITGQIMNNNSEVTVKNGKILNVDGTIMSQKGTTNLINCYMSTKATPVYVMGGTVNITDCTLINEAGNYSLINNNGAVYISGTNSFTGEIYKSANKVINTNILAGTYNFDPTDFVDAENSTITQDGESWVVAAK